MSIIAEKYFVEALDTDIGCGNLTCMLTFQSKFDHWVFLKNVCLGGILTTMLTKECSSYSPTIFNALFRKDDKNVIESLITNRSSKKIKWEN